MKIILYLFFLNFWFLFNKNYLKINISRKDGSDLNVYNFEVKFLQLVPFSEQ